MDLKDGASVVADLTTVGRKSGLPRTVELRFTYHQGGFYASSSRIQGKHWCENLIHNPAVVISVKDKKIAVSLVRSPTKNCAKKFSPREVRRATWIG